MLATETQPMTKAQVLKLVRQKCGKTAGVKENKGAYSKSQREQEHERTKERVAKKNAIKDRQREIGGNTLTQLRKLGESAKFVCDVNAQEPSLSELRKALAQATEWIALADDLRDLEDESRQLRTWMQRYDAFYDTGNPFPARHIVASGDTWDEVAGKLQKRN